MQVDITAPNCEFILPDYEATGSHALRLPVFIQEMSLQVRNLLHGFCGAPEMTSRGQMHYNEGADLLTYLVDPLVFEIVNGYVKALTGPSYMLPLSTCASSAHQYIYRKHRPWLGDRNQRGVGQRDGCEVRG